MGTATATIQRETLSDALWAELLPLLERHWNEAPQLPGLSFRPNRALYDGANRAGILRVWTLRDEAWVLVGYLSAVVTPHQHDDETLVAMITTLFIEPRHRGALVLDLLAHVKSSIRAEGVRFLQMAMCEEARGVVALLRRCGLAPIETVYSMRLEA